MTNSLNGSTLAPDFNLTQSRESISALLKTCDATITFTKKDGTERAMKCTLREGVAIPYEKKTERTRERNDDNLPVWDLEANAWRSITVSKIQSLEIS